MKILVSKIIKNYCKFDKTVKININQQISENRSRQFFEKM
nr:MAG TPA: hypothetical protein [Caudoviricetes sp.]